MLPNQDKILAFWHEVTATINSLLDETDMHSVQEVMAEYENRLKTIDSNLTFHFERDEMNQKIDMVFGCDGYTQSIGSVLTLVQAAPDIEGIDIIAFNPRHATVPEMIKVADMSFVIEEIFYQLRLEQGELHLSLYINDLSSDPENPNVEAAMIYLDAILGEFDMMTRVSSLNFYPIPQSPEDFVLDDLRTLRQAFDDLRQDVPLIGVTVH